MRVGLAASFLLFFLAGLARAEEGAQPDRYLRLDDRGDRLVLQVAARTFVREEGSGPSIQLVGAVHVADAGYYARIQDRLDRCDLVLYESVMPGGAGRLRPEPAEAAVEDTRRRLAFLAGVARVLAERPAGVPGSTRAVIERAEAIDPRLADYVRGALVDAWGAPIVFLAAKPGPFRFSSLGADGAVGGEGAAADLHAGPDEGAAFYENVVASSYNLQRELGAAFGLAWQGEGIDYAREHFTPSDMDLAELLRAIERRGGDPAFLDTALAGGGLSGIAARFMIGLLKLGGALSGGRLTVVLKAMLVTALASPALEEGQVSGVDAGTMEAVLLDRNTVVLDDLDAWIAALGTEAQAPVVGVFYGAAHMRDFEVRLRERGYRPVRTEWESAIEVDVEASGLSRERFEALRERMERALETRMRDAPK